MLEDIGQAFLKFCDSLDCRIGKDRRLWKQGRTRRLRFPQCEGVYVCLWITGEHNVSGGPQGGAACRYVIYHQNRSNPAWGITPGNHRLPLHGVRAH